MEINSMTYVYFIYKLSKIIPLFLFFFFGQDPNENSATCQKPPGTTTGNQLPTLFQFYQMWVDWFISLLKQLENISQKDLFVWKYLRETRRFLVRDFEFLPYELLAGIITKSGHRMPE